MHRALEIGEKIGNKQIIGYACALLAFTYAELGLLGDEAVAYGKRAHEIARELSSDHFLYFKSLLGLAHIYLVRGQCRQPSEIAKMLLGKVYSQIGARTGPASLSVVAKNAGFLMKNIPFAVKKAEEHFKKAIEVAKEIGAPGLLGQSYLNLGLLCKAKKKTENAKEYISAATRLFEECEAEGFLNLSREEMESLVDSKVK